MGLATALVAVRATAVLRPRRAAASWSALSGAVALSGCGWAVLTAGTGGGAAAQWLGALLVLASGVLSSGGLLALGGLRRLDDRLAAMDTAVVAVALGALTWALVGTAAFSVEVPTTDRLLAVTLPSLDVLLLAFALRLVLAGGADARSGLLLVWAGAQTVADGAQSWRVLSGADPLSPAVLVLHLLACAALGLAATVPPGAWRRRGGAGAGRLARTVVVLAVLPLPGLLVVRAVQGSLDGLLVVTAGSAAVTGLLVLRALLSASGGSARPGPGARSSTVRLVCAFLVLALLPLAGLTTFAVHESRATMEQELVSRLRATAAVGGDQVSDELSRLQALLTSYATRRLPAEVVVPGTGADRAELDRQLRSLVDARPDVFSARVSDLTGAPVRENRTASAALPDTELVAGAHGAAEP